MSTRFTSLVEGQDQLARQIEALPDSEARDAYRALLIFVHQLRRLKLGQGKPTASDDPDALADSFEDYFNDMDLLSDEELGADYETVKRVASSAPPMPKLEQQPFWWSSWLRRFDAKASRRG